MSRKKDIPKSEDLVLSVLETPLIKEIASLLFEHVATIHHASSGLVLVMSPRQRFASRVTTTRRNFTTVVSEWCSTTTPWMATVSLVVLLYSRYSSLPHIHTIIRMVRRHNTDTYPSDTHHFLVSSCLCCSDPDPASLVCENLYVEANCRTVRIRIPSLRTSHQGRPWPMQRLSSHS
jgi:hypothetical protein